MCSEYISNELEINGIMEMWIKIFYSSFFFVFVLINYLLIAIECGWTCSIWHSSTYIVQLLRKRKLEFIKAFALIKTLINILLVGNVLCWLIFRLLCCNTVKEEYGPIYSNLLIGHINERLEYICLSAGYLKITYSRSISQTYVSFAM